MRALNDQLRLGTQLLRTPFRDHLGSVQTRPRPWATDGRDRTDYLNRILPRSIHLSLAVLESSLTKNFNKGGVRLWTDPRRERCRT